MTTGTYTRLRNSPLVHVLAQVAFHPVLDMAEYLKAIQAELRPLGFVRLSEGSLPRLTIQAGDAPPTIVTFERWEFTDRENTLSVILTRDFVVLQTSRYAHYPAFSTLFSKVLDIIEALVPVSLAARVGLRYVNSVRLSADEGFDDFLDRGLLGFPFPALASELASNIQFATHAMAATQEGTLLVRTYGLPARQAIPPDLTPNALRYDERFTAHDGAVALDIDHFMAREIEFGAAALIDTLDGLHSLAKQAFEGSITQHALDVWGPIETVAIDG